MKKILLLMPVLMLALISSANATIYECDSCSDCTTKVASAGNYDTVKLNTSIYIADASCVVFNDKDNIIFDCDEYSISGNNPPGFGLSALDFQGDSDNNTIINCVNLTNFYSNIFFDDSSNLNKVYGCGLYGATYGVYENSGGNLIDGCHISQNNIGVHIRGGGFTVQNSNISYNTYEGVQIYNSVDAKVYNNTLRNRYSISLSSADRAHVANNTIHGDFNPIGSGLRIEGSDDAIIEYNNISWARWGIDFLSSVQRGTWRHNYITHNNYGIIPAGLYFSSYTISYYNDWYDNYFDNNLNIRLTGSANPNQFTWNVTVNCSQTSIIGGCFGGNYWSDYTGSDWDGDGIGETSYTTPPAGDDDAPLTNNISCGSCSTCNTMLNNASGPGVINMVDDISSLSNCISMTTNGKTLDCQGHTITSTGSGSFLDSAVFLDADDLVLKNCEIEGGFNNIFADNFIDNFQIINNTIHDNLYSSGACVRCKTGHNNGLFEYNEIYNCYDEAILRDGPGGLVNFTFRHNIIHDSDGIAMDDSVYYNNTLYDNIRAFDFNNGPDGAEVYDNLVYDNTYGLYITQACSNNDIYNNTFNNTNNFYVDSVSGTGNTMSYNLWSDYNGWDNTGDGVGNTDLPYVVAAGIFEDNLPLTDNTDTTGPNISISSPQSVEYSPSWSTDTSVDVDIDASAEDLISGLDTCLWNYDGGANYTFTAPTTVEVSGEGEHYVEFYCNDTAELWGYQKVQFTYASVPPLNNLRGFAPIAAIMIAAGWVISSIGLLFKRRELGLNKLTDAHAFVVIIISLFITVQFVILLLT